MSGDTPARARWRRLRKHFLADFKASACDFFTRLLEKRRSALEAAATGAVVTEVDPSKAAPQYQMQGDLSLYTLDALNARQKLFQCPAVTRHIRECWRLLCDTTGRDVVDLDTYTFFFTCCAKSLMPTQPARVSDIQSEWLVDAKGRDVMDVAAFGEALFELVDQWTTSTEVDEYVSVLGRVKEKTQEAIAECGGDLNAFVAAASKTRRSKRNAIATAPTTPAAEAVAAPAAESGVETRTYKGLPRHTCAVDGEGSDRCLACILIREWEAARLAQLRALQDSGIVPWIGAWSARPECYTGGLGGPSLDATAVLGPGRAGTALTASRPTRVSAPVVPVSPLHAPNPVEKKALARVGSNIALLSPSPSLAPVHDLNAQLVEGMARKGPSPLHLTAPAPSKRLEVSPCRLSTAVPASRRSVSKGHFEYREGGEPAWPSLDRAFATPSPGSVPLSLPHTHTQSGGGWHVPVPTPTRHSVPVSHSSGRLHKAGGLITSPLGGFTKHPPAVSRLS